MDIFTHLPASILQWFAIFISIIIEALPFVLLGTILSGFIEVYDFIGNDLPNNHSIFWCTPHWVTCFDVKFFMEVIKVWQCDIGTKFGWCVHINAC